MTRLLLVSLALSLGSVANAAATEARSVTFQPDWFANGQFAGFFVAQQDGLYAEAGLDVAIESFDFGTDFIGRVAGGGPVIGTAEAYILVDQIAAGEPLVAIGAVLGQSPAGYIHLADTGIRGPADLAGKRVGVHNYAEALLPFFLKQAGLAADAAEGVVVKHDVSMLLNGTVDLHQGYAIDEMLRLQQMTERPVDILLFDELGLPMVSMVLYTNRSFLEEQPETVRAFLQASIRGWKRAVEQPGRTATLITEAFPDPEVDPAILPAQIEALRSFVFMPGREPLSLAVDRWSAMQAAFLEAGMIDRTVASETSVLVPEP
jgi:ABC-type nitrate/sulfonate/bicarbonate transport system substrate-binding protein